MNKAQLPIFNYSIKNQSNDALDIFIDGDIVDADTQTIMKAYWGDDTSVSYKSFRDQVNQSDASVINVFINSGGGQVSEAMAIHDFLQELRNKGKKVNTEGRGIIASSATYILMAGEAPSMSANSFFMVHNVGGAIYGNVNEIENYAATMRKFNDAINSFYQKATGLSKTVISNMMDAETWMTADEAKQKGFIKNITGEITFSNSIKPEKWLFENKSILNSYNAFAKKNIKNLSSAEQKYLQDMTALNEQAISLSKDILNNTQDPFVQSLAGGTIEDASDDNEDIQEALTGADPDAENKSNKLFPKNKNFKMDTNKITEAISNGFNSLLEKLGIKDKANDESVKNAFNEFSKGITDNLKDVPDNASIEELVNKAVAKSFESVPENFTKAINEAVKGSLKKSDLDEALKNTLSNEDFKKQMDDLKTSIIDKIGGKTTGEEKPKVENERKFPKNRFTGKYAEYNN